MPALPTPLDPATLNGWGTTLNSFLGVALDSATGDLKSAVAGNGLSVASSVLSVNVDGSTLEINADALRIKDLGVTAAKLAAGAAVSNIGYTPVNKAGDTGLGSLGLGSNTLTAGAAILGTNPASAGSLRLPNAGWIAGRNAANGADVNLIRANSSNITEIGGRAAVGGTVSPYDTNLPRLYIRNDWTGTETSANLNVLQLLSIAKGAWTTAHFVYAQETRVQDHSSVVQKTITGATRSGTTITVTTSATHGYVAGDRVMVDSVTHTFNQEINGSWVISNVPTTTSFDYVVAGVSSGSYTSGGITTNRAGYAAHLALVTPSVARGGLTGVNLHADDVTCFFGGNNGTAKATDFIYQSHTAGIGTEFDTAGSFDGSNNYGFLLNNLGIGQSVRATHYGTGNIPEFMGRMARGTFDAPLRTKNTDLLLRISAAGAYAASDVAAATVAGASARIDFTANEDFTSTGMGSRMVFYTTPIGSITPAERFRIPNTDGIDFNSGTFTTYQIRLKNNVWVVARNNAGAADVNVLRIDTSDRLRFGTTIGVTYTPTNVTTDRSFDANATTLDELADIVGTLIGDLQTGGVLG